MSKFYGNNVIYTDTPSYSNENALLAPKTSSGHFCAVLCLMARLPVCLLPVQSPEEHLKIPDRAGA